MNKFLLLILLSGLHFDFVIGQNATQPSLMIFPSDNLLLKLGCMRTVVLQGDSTYYRDYEKAMVKSTELKFAISAIQERFADVGFPVEDLEQALKADHDSDTEGEVEGYDVDPRARILRSTRPDIFLELTYDMVKSGMGCKLTYILRAVDAYTFKAIGNAQHPGIEVLDCDITQALAQQTELNITNLQSLMQNHFKTQSEGGFREITLSIKMKDGAAGDFRQDNCQDMPYNRWFLQWVRENSIGGAMKATKNTPTSLEFTNIRIPLFNIEDQTPMVATDWAYKLTKALKANCSTASFDNTQGLGKAVIVITKMGQQ